MQPQIVHETEVHRQHVRLKIPIQIEVDGVRYQADDWSVGGFGVESVMTSRQPGEHFAVRMIFPFEEFDMSMRLDARMVYVDQEHGRFGCAFLGLSKEQVAVFRYLVDAYLSGEVVSAGDILQIRSRDSHSRGRLPPDFLTAPQMEPWQDKMRRYGLLGALGVAGLILAALIVLGLRERFFTIDIQSAVIEAPVTEVRAPIPGRFLALLEPGAEVEQGFMLGTIRGPEGSIAPVESPCHCIVLDQIGLSGQTYQVGDPLLALIGVNEALMVRAQLPLEEVERLEVGDRAEIRVPGRAGAIYGEIVRINVRPRLEAWLNPNSEFPISRRLAQVVVRPDRPFELADFGSLVSLRFL
jgi:alginate biosynthesis protein Alg44